MTRPRVVPLLLALLTGVVTSCTSADDPTPAPSPTPSPTARPTPAEPAPRPQVGRCYDLDYQQAIAPTSSEAPVSCRDRFTAQTFFVGTLDAVVDGHLLAVDSRRVQAHIAAECPRLLDRFLGGTPRGLRLSMFRTAWFSPTVEASDQGEDWYRCDVIALARDGELAALSGPVKGVLGRDEWQGTYGMCGTAEPGTPEFARVACSESSAWRAIATVDATGGSYPGAKALQDRDQAKCEDPARAIAADPLRVTWAYEAPTRQQWDSGQRYGVCWVPD